MVKLCDFIFAGTAALLLAVSCTVETPEGSGQGQGTQGRPLTTINAQLEGSSEDGRTSISYTTAGGTGNNPVMVWQNDKITVIASDASSSVFSIQSGKGTRSAVFDGYLASTTTPYYAVFPHNYGALLEDRKIKFSLPQTQIASTSANSLMPAVAYLPSADASATFRNVCGMLRMGLTSSAEVTLGKVELYALGGEMLWGEASIPATSVAAQNWTAPQLSGGDNKLILDFSLTASRTLSSTVAYFYAAVPPGALSNGVRMIFYDDLNNPIDEICTAADLTVGRAHVVRITNIEVGEYTLLDLEGSANCYIADRTNTTTTYKFCTFMGNSGNLVPSKPDSVEELWETQNGGSTFNEGNVGYLIDNLRYSGGCISFTVQDRPGNALIAAKNSSTEIMWSWHIWLPYGGYVPSVTLSNGTVCQDRNLGSLYTSSNTSAMGLLYQYARKDPFTAPYNLATTNTNRMVTSPSTAIQSTFTLDQKDTLPKSIAWTIKNPNIIVDTRNSWDGDKKATWRGTKKSMYDPCPPGWKVPDQGAFDNLVFNGSWDGIAHRVQDNSTVDIEDPDTHIISTYDNYFTGTGRRYLNNARDAHTVESPANSYYWTTDDGGSTSGTQSARYSFTDIGTDYYYRRNAAKKFCMAVRCVAE